MQVIRSCWVSLMIVESTSSGRMLMFVYPCQAKMGYKQELKRQYSTMQMFAIAFSIMGLVPSIASTIAFSLPAGPVGMVWVSLWPRRNTNHRGVRSLIRDRDRDGLRLASSF